MSNAKHTFSIAQKTNSLTGKPFGDKFAGEFIVRRPSILDRSRIELKHAAFMNTYGSVNADNLSEGVKVLNYALATVTTLAEKSPDWFDAENLYDESDELAVLAAWQEVTDWLGTFRHGKNPAGSGEAGE